MTAVRTPADIRADLEQATADLEALSEGDLSWEVAYPELRNAVLQDLAVEMKAERVAELERELRYVNGEAGQ